jgi:hypothetical protein
MQFINGPPGFYPGGPLPPRMPSHLPLGMGTRMRPMNSMSHQVDPMQGVAVESSGFVQPEMAEYSVSMNNGKNKLLRKGTGISASSLPGLTNKKDVKTGRGDGGGSGSLAGFPSGSMPRPTVMTAIANEDEVQNDDNISQAGSNSHMKTKIVKKKKTEVKNSPSTDKNHQAKKQPVKNTVKKVERNDMNKKRHDNGKGAALNNKNIDSKKSKQANHSIKPAAKDTHKKGDNKSLTDKKGNPQTHTNKKNDPKSSARKEPVEAKKTDKRQGA